MSYRVSSLFLLAALAIACDPALLDPPPSVVGSESQADAGEEKDSSLPDPGFSVRRVTPNHGPFIGGTTAVIRGNDFVDGMNVHIGGRAVQEADVELLDSTRLQIVTPAGEAGLADVEVLIDDKIALLTDGFTYDSIYADPASATVGGGRSITVYGLGLDFKDSDRIFFGPNECTDVEVISADALRCKAPPSSQGVVDLILRRADGAEVRVDDGFTFFDASDPFNGGLGGGPLAAELIVTVLDSLTGSPIPGAYVQLGDSVTPTFKDVADSRGKVTFRGDLPAPASVHVAMKCFQRTSFVAFDASQVTAFLAPILDPSCIDLSMGSGGGGLLGRGRAGSVVAGNLIFVKPTEFSMEGSWTRVPQPRANEVRVAYVYASQPCVGSGACINPDPTIGGGFNRAQESEISPQPPYEIFVRPGAMTVYALAGLENRDTGEFVPYLMGAARNVLIGPGERIEDVDIVMNIPLDHVHEITLKELPPRLLQGPDTFEVSSVISLGGEGYIERRHNGVLLDSVTRSLAAKPFRLFSQPSLQGTMSSARFDVTASWYTAANGSPSTHRVVRGEAQLESTLAIGGFLGLVELTSPAFGEALDAGREVEWRIAGKDPSFFQVAILDATGSTLWTQYVAGIARKAALPDFSALPELDDLPPGTLRWAVTAIEIPGFNFDEFTYRDLSRSRWSAWSTNQYSLQR